MAGASGRRTKHVRLSDVAAAAGVSVALASRVINGHDQGARSSEATKERIRKAARDLGYVADIAARNLQASRTGLIGLVVHDLTSPIYAELLAGARSAAVDRGYFLILGDADELLENPATFETLIAARRVDGIIVQGGHRAFEAKIEEIAQILPTVVVNAPMEDRAPGVSGVYADEVAASGLLTSHLVDAGHRRIGLIVGPETSATARLRRRGVEEELARHSLLLAPSDVASTEWTADGGREGLAALLERWALAESGHPTALIAGNTLIAAGAFAEAAARGVTIPGELAVGAIHDSWIARTLVPSLTTVSLPLREMGIAAVRRLLDSAESTGDILVSDPPPLLHAREST
jgi:LacI family transcriptional regulator